MPVDPASSLGQELVARLSMAGISITGYDIDDGAVDLRLGRDVDLADISSMSGTISMWLDHKGGELQSVSAARPLPDGGYELSIEVAPKSGLPAVYHGE